MPDLLADLNLEQRRAVVHVGGPLLVVAGPGSGKTRVVTRRIAYRIESGGARSDHAVGITFTNRAAQEMQTRLRELLGPEVRVPIGTFHWLCSGILRRHGHRIGLDARFRVLSPLESRHVIRAVVVEAGLHANLSGGMVDAISGVKNGGGLQAWASRTNVPEESMVAVAERYRQRLRDMRALDLDDLILSTVQLLDTEGQVRKYFQGTLEELVVDEYQDTNPVQRALVRLLTPVNGSTVVVGDEDQAIYGWRQADAASMIRFLADFPDATVVRLEQSYRSTKRILRAAGKLIGHNGNRVGKVLRTSNPAGEMPVCLVADSEIDEANWIAEQISTLAKREGLAWSDFGILYRINVQSRALEDALVRHGVPYRVFSGPRFYDRPEVRRVVAYLRLSLDASDDEATAELAGGLAGVGPKRLEILRARASESGLGLLQVLGGEFAQGAIPRSVASDLRQLQQRAVWVGAKRGGPLRELLMAAVEVVRSELENTSGVELDMAMENLGELQSVLLELNSRSRTLRLLIDRLAIDGHQDDVTSGVSLMTLHSAKGLEFPVVFMPGLEEGILPHRRSLDNVATLEEERRLCYVGMTRAQWHLFLSYAHGRLLAGSATIGFPSRFIAEMGHDNLTVRMASQAKQKPRVHDVAVGEQLHHARWGVGTVLAVEAGGRETLVTMMFESVGRQRVQLCHAPLSRGRSESADVLAG